MGQSLAAVLIFLLALSLSACGVLSNSGQTFIPDLAIECDSAQVVDCSGSGLNVYVGLKPSLSESCQDYLAGVSSAQLYQSFEVSGNAVSAQSGGILTATISTWVNSTGGSQDLLDSGDYSACGYVDTNGNGLLDTNEPVGEGTITAGKTGATLNSWHAAFN